LRCEAIVKVIIPGGSGQVGQILARDFCARGWDVIVLSRRGASRASDRSGRVIGWDGKSAGGWCDEIDGSDIVINLAGRSVNCRYNQANRREIIDSRVESTKAITAAIRDAGNPPPLLLQASTATIYAHRYDAGNDDIDGIIGGDEPNVPDTWRFSIDVAKAWEAAATAIDLPSTRTVLLRSAITLSPDRGSVFEVLLRLVRFALGGTNGDGRQYVSWIHDADFVAAIDWLIEHQDLEGPINLSSPNPVPNREFMRTLRECWGQRIGLPATRWMLEIGARLLQTETELILKSRRVIPARLLQSGFVFKFADWKSAAADLCCRY
jgi:uncharacterized protein (TIGR01777 family)